MICLCQLEGDQPSGYRPPPQGGQPRQPDDVDADTEEHNLINKSKCRQMDPTLAQQHRRMEMERAQQAQPNTSANLHIMQRNPQLRTKLMTKVKNLFGNFRNNVKSLVVVVAIFILLNVGPISTILLKFISILRGWIR